jgi:hypothetical protein
LSFPVCLYGIDDSTECWDQVDIDEWINKAQPNGIVFISILHPCFKGKETKWIKNNGSIEVLVSDYHNSKEWVEKIEGMRAPLLYRHRALSDYVKAFVKNSFTKG